jgi:hypothetical protein
MGLLDAMDGVGILLEKTGERLGRIIRLADKLK